MSTPTQTVIAARNHRRAVRFFWCLLIGATTVSLIGNVVHAVLPYIPRIVVQIGAAAVPPVALLAAVHGIALAVRAGASGSVYRSAVGAVAVIGAGAFAVSFIALCDLMHAIGYSAATAWAFPAIIDTAVAVAAVMLVALGDKPARRTRTATVPFTTHTSAMRLLGHSRAHSAKAELKPVRAAPSAGAHGARRAGQDFASVQLAAAQTVESAQTVAAQEDAELASELIASGATTQPVETVIAVLRACRGGVSINAAAKALGINYRTAQRIVQGAEHRQLIAAS